jgi:Bacterial protein of unknown function (DUF922)
MPSNFRSNNHSDPLKRSWVSVAAIGSSQSGIFPAWCFKLVMMSRTRYISGMAAPNRWIVCASATVLSVTLAAAVPDLIEWSPDRRLTRGDFKSATALPQGVSARSFVAIDASWACENGAFEPHIRAVFDPGRSSWRSSNPFDASNARQSTLNDREVLQHEQVHFDIAELIARKIRQHFASLTDICTRPGGMIPLRAVVEDYRQELDDQQSRYDRETLFRIDGRMQSIWTARIATELRSGNSK